MAESYCVPTCLHLNANVFSFHKTYSALQAVAGILDFFQLHNNADHNSSFSVNLSAIGSFTASLYYNLAAINVQL